MINCSMVGHKMTRTPAPNSPQYNYLISIPQTPFPFYILTSSILTDLALWELTSVQVISEMSMKRTGRYTRYDMAA